MYCKSGEKPLIKYSFGNGQQRQYQSSYSPIDVQTKPFPVDSQNRINNDGFGLIMDYADVATPSTFIRVVRDYMYIPNVPRGGSNPPVYENLITYIDCNGTKWEYLPPEYCSYPYNLFNCRRGVGRIGSRGLISIDASLKCPTPSTERCSIQVLYNNLVIFQDQGDCTVNFSVQCGDCADDEIKCEKPSYPGYCCIKCSEITEKLQGIENLLRSK